MIFDIKIIYEKFGLLEDLKALIRRMEVKNRSNLFERDSACVDVMEVPSIFFSNSEMKVFPGLEGLLTDYFLLRRHDLEPILIETYRCSSNQCMGERRFKTG